MTVLLPKAGKSISEVMKEMDADKLQKLSNDMDRCQVDLKFPKFTTEMDLSLNQIISKLGAPSIFQPGTADFSRFANGSFYVSKMLQKAKIEVSERGTKAAAVAFLCDADLTGSSRDEACRISCQPPIRLFHY